MRELLAHVQFRGMIRERTVEPVARLLRFLRTRRRVRGVLFDISSGGGASVASRDLYLAVKRLDAVKPVVASIGGLGASGGYLAALGARRVFAYPESGVGSIGVVYPHLAVRSLLTRIGVDVELVHQGRHKDAYQGYRALTDEERAKLQAVTDVDYRLFVETVASERHRSVEQILPLATGEFWSGKQALELGLVDALGDPEAALEELAKLTGVPARRSVLVRPPRPFLERMIGGFAPSMTGAVVERLREAAEEAVLESWFGRT
ncbi:MAG TPA: signal peptide peptidase SppA [Thermoplasmata archaeon]|nr:signal peptide peptidase SppA [Thermoplasmata archaeon]